MSRIPRVARDLLEYGLELESEAAAQVGESFSGVPEADELLERLPAAFLIGILFTQGIPAERAWAGPWLLRQRLGHFDLLRLAGEQEAVLAAFHQPPMLHRFKNTLPRWVCSAARRIVDEYGGDASRIWARGTHVLEVTERLSAFDGIGRKKAVMGVEILIRHFGAELEGATSRQVAYDVQVRRVFLRTGLAKVDTPSAMEAAAAQINPEAPGVLDLAAWLVGRETCRPKSPKCDECRLGAGCPRLTWLGAPGVGARSAGGRSGTG